MDWFLLIIGFLTVTSLAGIITDFLNKQSKLKLEAMKQEVKLEKARKENFLLETEKLRLEIEQAKQQLLIDAPSRVKEHE